MNYSLTGNYKINDLQISDYNYNVNIVKGNKVLQSEDQIEQYLELYN